MQAREILKWKNSAYCIRNALPEDSTEYELQPSGDKREMMSISYIQLQS